MNLTTESKTAALNNALRSFDIPEKYFIHSANTGRNSKFAIASKSELGGINTHSAFMSYEELNMYLSGYNRRIKNPLL